MPTGAAISAAGSLGSALIGSSAARSAANTQADASRSALSMQQANLSQAQQNFQPYLDIGKNATYSLSSLYGFPTAEGGGGGKPDYSQFYNTPDYGFAYDQGRQATQNVLSAKGNLLSGGGLSALTSWGQGLASQQYGNYFNRLMGLSQLGAGAAGNVGNVLTQGAGIMGNTIQGIGQAQASGTIGAANAWSGGLQGAANSLALPYYADKYASMRSAQTQSSYQAPNWNQASTSPNYLSPNAGGSGGFLNT